MPYKSALGGLGGVRRIKPPRLKNVTPEQRQILRDAHIKRIKEQQAQVRKSAWGVVTKLDQADVHVVTTMTGPKRLRRVKKKRTVET